MIELSPDRELIVAYAAGRSESAFRALLGRHVDMVFATALRQTGDAALSEEITQNVFVLLARKAPRLARFETVEGWLFRATILETKARLRSELRLLHLMKFRKTQMTAACLVVAIAPLAWQRFSQAVLAKDQSTVNAQIAEVARQAESLESEAAQASSLANQARTDTANSRLRLNGLRAKLAEATVRPAYRWNDSSPYARSPKSMISRMMTSSAVQNRRGQLSDQIKQALQMTDGEVRETQAAATKFLSSFESLEARTMTEVPATDKDLFGHAADQTRVFDVPYIGSNAMSELRDDFFGQITSTLGADRAEVFTNALAGWMPVTEDYNGISGGQAVYNSSLRMRFYQPITGDKSIEYVVSTAQPSQCSGTISPAEVSPLYAPYLQDWFAAMQSSSP